MLPEKLCCSLPADKEPTNCLDNRKWLPVPSGLYPGPKLHPGVSQELQGLPVGGQFMQDAAPVWDRSLLF